VGLLAAGASSPALFLGGGWELEQLAQCGRTRPV